MELTQQEVILINNYREDQARQEQYQEELRRKQSIAATVSDLIAQAKQLLIDAKQVAEDNGMKYQIEDMVTTMINEVSDGQYWYGSDQSLC